MVSTQERWLPNSAVQLRTSISEQLQVRDFSKIFNMLLVYCVPVLTCHVPSLLQSDCQLQNAVDLIVDCAFGNAPFKDTSQIPAQSTCVDVAVRESAYNPLHPQNQLQQQDETLYVAFQQRIQIKVFVVTLHKLRNPTAATVQQSTYTDSSHITAVIPPHSCTLLQTQSMSV